MHICFVVLTGKDDSLPRELGVTESVVMKFVRPISGRGHHLYCDNFYTSPVFSYSFVLVAFMPVARYASIVEEFLLKRG